MVIAATLRDAPDHREPREERREADATTADAARRRDVHFALESAVPTVTFECKMHLSTRRSRSRSSRTAATTPSWNLSSDPVRKAH